MEISKKKFWFEIIFVSIFILSFIAVRVPLLHEPLGSEEGIFAEIIVNRPPGPCYSLAGRIDGQNIYSYISHPAFPYELLRLGGYISQKMLTYPIYLNDTQITPKLRIVTSLYQLVFWLLLLLFSSRLPHRRWLFLITFMVMISPLAVKTSTFLQIDNSSGMLLCGIAALLFGVSETFNFHKGSWLLLFIGGLLAGLGKQEWSFALFAALLSTLLLHKLVDFEILHCNALKATSYIMIGLIVGNLLSYLYDSGNYSRGLYYVQHFSKLHNDSPGNWSFLHWLELTKIRLPFIYVCLVLILIIVVSFISNKRPTALSCLIFLYGTFLFIGYILSDWRAEPRYFAPGLAVLAVAVIVILPITPSLWNRRTIIFGLLSVFLSTIVFLFNRSPDRNLHLEQINAGHLKSSSDTVLYIKSGAGWNKPDVDYVNNNLPFDKAKQRVSKKYNKRLIKPEYIVEE